MTTTPHMDVTLLEASQSQKEVTVNEALYRLDALLNCGAKDKDLATPPASPSEGDVYIVAASATDDWAGEDGNIAYFEQIWRFVTPLEGMTLWVNDEDMLYVYDGSDWRFAAPSPYEEGTFTARFGAIAPTYTSRRGDYTRIGNMVFAEIELNIASLNTSDTDENNITDLPYPVGNDGFIVGSIDIDQSTLLSTSTGTIVRIETYPGNGALLQLKDETGAPYSYDSGLFNSSGLLYLTIQYRI